ncbi:MAG: AmmeMemoRadiSam system protein B [Rhodothermia bacterium]|nr:AmmeMemoRadiSam system protein B [Rhodothermia bacterium]
MIKNETSAQEQKEPPHDGNMRSVVAELLREAEGAFPDAEIFAVVVPATGTSAGRLAASLYKNLEGRSYDSVVIIAAGSEGAAGRINIWSADTYAGTNGALAIDDHLRNELCDEDDDIYVSDEGHDVADGIRAQLPFLEETVGSFRIVPVVMGEETPEFCRELGAALAEVVYSQRTLIVAAVDLEGGSDESVSLLAKYMTALDESRLFGLIRSQAVKLRGGGALMAALIAGSKRGARRIEVLDARLPGERPGGITAVIAK